MFDEQIKRISTDFEEPKANLFFRLSLITHLLGLLNRDISYMHRLPKEAVVYKANIRISFVDLLIQIYYLAAELGFTEEELKEFALNRYKEKLSEFKKRGWVEVP